MTHPENYVRFSETHPPPKIFFDHDPEWCQKLIFRNANSYMRSQFFCSEISYMNTCEFHFLIPNSLSFFSPWFQFSLYLSYQDHITQHMLPEFKSPFCLLIKINCSKSNVFHTRIYSGIKRIILSLCIMKILIWSKN